MTTQNQSQKLVSQTEAVIVVVCLDYPVKTNARLLTKSKFLDVIK